ncbi:MAG: hypothetical protein AB7O24_26105 [Kofleriaceae bacterium]
MPGRIRTIKPELRELLAFASLSDGAARLFLMLPTMADDKGRCPAAPSQLAGAVFFVKQRSANVVGQLLAELEAAELIRRYQTKGGSFLEIAGWSDKGSATYQFIKKPHPFRFPAPEWETETPGETRVEHRPDSPDLEQRSSNSEREPESERDRCSELSPSSPPPPAPGGWVPPAGGRAEAAIQDRIGSGELTDAQVRRSIAKFWDTAAARGKSYGEAHADAAIAKWIRDERASTKRSRDKLRLPVDEDGAYPEYFTRALSKSRVPEHPYGWALEGDDGELWIFDGRLFNGSVVDSNDAQHSELLEDAREFIVAGRRAWDFKPSPRRGDT